MGALKNHPGMWLNDAASADLNALEDKYGVIRINRAGVTEREQQDVIDKWDRGERAGLYEPRRPARESDHVKNGGEAVDIYNYTDDRAKMREFGFEQVYPSSDPVHYKHVRRVTGGNADAKVRREQEWLNMSRGENLVADGIYGPATRAAYIRYQTFLGVTADGIWGDGTQAAHARYYDEWTRARQGSVINKTHTQIDYADIQRALNRKGYSLAVDNDWGPASSAALADFQRRNGLTVDRIVGAKTWALLNS